LSSSGIFLSEPDSLKAAAQVIKGFHDFFPYAYEFWFEHLSAVTELVDDGSKLRDIEDAMEKLWLLFRKQSSTHGDIPLVEGPDSVPADESIVNPRLLSLPGPIREYILFKHDKLNTGQRVCKLLGMHPYHSYHSVSDAKIHNQMPKVTLACYLKPFFSTIRY
jgi:hypothetical protein